MAQQTTSTTLTTTSTPLLPMKTVSVTEGKTEKHGRVIHAAYATAPRGRLEAVTNTIWKIFLGQQDDFEMVDSILVACGIIEPASSTPGTATVSPTSIAVTRVVYSTFWLTTFAFQI